LKILLLNQAFYPDVVSTAQHAADLAVRLARSGHDLTVLASRRAYDNPERSFVSREIWNGIRIRRVSSLGLGKQSKWRRALDFGSFLIRCMVELARLPKFDVVIAMTSPPLIAFLAAHFVRWRGGKLVYWVMDLNPDEAIAAGWLREKSPVAQLLQRMSGFTLRRSARIVVLDRFMRTRVLAKGVNPAAVEVIPPWSHDNAVQDDINGRNVFRQKHGLDGKFVVMYSGNHSPCHPLDSLVDAACRLRNNAEIVFCFIGGGSEHAKVSSRARAEGLENIRCLPYQPMGALSASLNSADLHVVVMGDPFVGIVHPCKIYNILRLGKPVLYIGPSEGHVPDMIGTTKSREWFYPALHAQVDLIVANILAAADRPTGNGTEQREIATAFSEETLVAQMVETVQSSVERPPSPTGVHSSIPGAAADGSGIQ
jgi:colanic acid biosynthesis glycosyl transferase WcaI